jgi:colanic acid biosynthesis glycosyl transferase WcaI
VLRILIFGLNFAPELTGVGKYTGEMAQWLADRGHAVRVVTAHPYYPEWKVRPAPHLDCETLLGGSLKVIRCPLWVPEKPSGLKRILHLMSFALSSFPTIVSQAFWKPEVVFVVEPALFCAPAALVVAKLSGAKIWLHVQDFEVDAAFDLELLSAGWMRKVVLGFETFLMRHFDRVSTISSRMLERLTTKKVETSKQVFFPNWVDVAAIRPAGRGEIYRAELGIGVDDCVVLYSGTMGEKQGLETLIEAIALLKQEPSIRFVLCGEGGGGHGCMILEKIFPTFSGCLCSPWSASMNCSTLQTFMCCPSGPMWQT